MTTTLPTQNKERRFAFGANWQHFLETLNEARIGEAERSLREMLGVESLAGKSFLDIGSGSGLFSLAARRLGARVCSFDYDPQSVACTEELKRRYYAGNSDWSVERGSVLDERYMSGLGRFEVVYCWGVLHHTGDMMRALANAALPVASGGQLFIAIYNDQGWISRYWTWVKRIYNRSGLMRPLMILLHAPYLLGGRFFVRMLKGKVRLERGMSLVHDMCDWIGGYPFEVARPEEVIGFYTRRGFTLVTAETCGRRSGCNEFVFAKAGE